MITTHARQRLRERCGLRSKKQQLQNVKFARKKGVSHNSWGVTNDLRKYFYTLYYINSIKHGKDITIKIYNLYVYIFGRNGDLITVFPTDENYLKDIQETLRMRKQGKPVEEKSEDNTPIKQWKWYDPTPSNRYLRDSGKYKTPVKYLKSDEFLNHNVKVTYTTTTFNSA